MVARVAATHMQMRNRKYITATCTTSKGVSFVCIFYMFLIYFYTVTIFKALGFSRITDMIFILCNFQYIIYLEVEFTE